MMGFTLMVARMLGLLADQRPKARKYLALLGDRPAYQFALPDSPGACKDGWDDILVHQLDYRFGSCNFVELMPRLTEHL